jgi:hypothetical protein
MGPPLSQFAQIVILDDNAGMNGLSKFVVQTEFCPGLTEADADRAIAMLQGDAANDQRKAAAHEDSAVATGCVYFRFLSSRND